MGILIKLDLTENKSALNVAVLNDDEESLDYSKTGTIANFNIAFNKASDADDVKNINLSSEFTHVSAEHSEENSGGSVIDLTDEPPDENRNMCPTPSTTMGYFIVDKILGSRLNHRTNQHEFLLTLKSCSTTDNSWNPHTSSQPLDLCDPDTVLYVQRTDDLLIPRQDVSVEVTPDISINECWNSVKIEDNQMNGLMMEEDIFIDNSGIVKIDVPETESDEIFDLEAEKDPFCNSVDNVDEELEEKVFAPSNGSGLKCNNCGLSFTEPLACETHLKTCLPKIFHCSYCPRVFSREHYMRKHTKVHLNAVEHRCTMCGFTYGSVFLLSNHMKQTHRVRYLRKYTRRAKIVRRHRPESVDSVTGVHAGGAAGATTNAGDGSQFECAVCGRVFAQEKALKIHTTHVHRRPRLFNCAPETTLRKHELSECHQLACSVCGKMFKTVWRLRVHEQSHERTPLVGLAGSGTALESLPDTCSHCGKTFTIKANALVHENVAHNGDGRLMVNCIVCGLLLNKFSLQSHMFRHTGERPFKCKYCDYKAIQRISLKSHMWSKHGIVLSLKKRKPKETLAPSDSLPA